ncbi:MAG: hypothetical protein P4L64_09225 [Caulobacteraceae bacterium]|nr:hypothetical protein [Caulobacteraceae bacterium]
MELKTGSADFGNPISGYGPRTQVVPIIFPTALQSAAVGITGYTVGYGDGDDHHVGRVDVEISAVINDNVVLVTAALGLRDWSGDWDDTYYGSIDFAVLADLAPVPPRPDLIVAEVETNQSVQFFHAETYLTPQTAVPDNAIPLYSGKNTGLRVYADWDADLHLPLAALTGSVIVTPVGGSATTLTPLNPGGSITPRSADTINMAVIEHTLNFMIPSSLCSGTVEIAVQLWDQANPTSKSSIFSRTVVFADLPALNMFVVGINYTAQTPNLPAPTQAAFTGNGFAYLQKVYPQGTINQTGYSAITFGEDVNFTIGSQGGCGNGMSDLLDQMDDLRGSSSDIYMAVLPPLAQIQTPGSNIGGCARVGVGAVFVDQTADVPHETGHTLGRQHAPCDTGLCNPPPANVDPHYPAYGVLPAGSIGVFGFDPVAYAVLNPATNFDTMAYRFPQWISAYTYLAIAGAGHPSEGGSSSPGLGSAHALTDVATDTLFLALTVNRDRHVKRRVSFHFPALPRAMKPCTEYVVELLDVDREVLICAPLSCDCDDVGHHCWPKQFRSATPYPKGSRWLLVWEGERKIHEEWIPRPPKVYVERIDQDGEEVVIHWRGEPEGDDDDDACCCHLWYLVQWFDPEDEVWRGVAPRTRANSLRLPPSILWGKQEGVRLRILASCGVATGEALLEVRGRGRGEPRLDLISMRDGDRVGNQITVVPVDPTGRHVAIDRATWIHEGREISQDKALNLRVLPQGRSEVKVFVDGEGLGGLTRSWIILREGDHFSLAEEGEQRRTRIARAPHVHPHPPPAK